MRLFRKRTIRKKDNKKCYADWPSQDKGMWYNGTENRDVMIRNY